VARRNVAKFPGSLDEWQQIWHSTAAYRHEEGIDYPFDALCDAGLKQLVKTPGDNNALQELHNIAVLPFDNLSGDLAQEYFSDGITESIILNLSLFPGLQVKSRNSSFAFKEQIKSLGEISRELNVDYIVEGSIRKSNDRVRITVQLIEAHNGNQVWGKRYDSIIGDIFDLEEELSRTIAATVTGRVNSDLQRIAIAKNATHQQSYDLLLGGMFHCNKFTREDMVIARGKLERCLELDPENVRAHALLHLCHVINWMERWVKDYENSFKLAGEYIHKALKLDPEVGMVQMYYAEYMTFCRDYEAANYHIEKALAMNPNDPDSLAFKAFNLNAIGEFESALEIAKKCYQLDPYHPWVEWIIAEAQLYCGHPEESIQTILNANITQSYLRALLVVAYFKIGDDANARLAMQQFQQINRDSMLSMPETRDEWTTYWSDNLPYRDTQMTEDMIEYLMSAGLCDDINSESEEIPSIAVLPFENMSGDPEQEYFSDGITADIISTLFRFKHMRIVSRYSTFQYKNQQTSISEIAEQQGVRYILEGSVRKSGNRIRVNADLIDSSNEEICWSERYDRDLDDIFAVQDEITKNITVAMKVHFEDGDAALQRAAGTKNIRAWELVLTAADLQDTYIRQNILDARAMIKQALKIDPSYCYAWVVLGWTHWQEAYSGWCESFENTIQQAENAVTKALDLEPDNAEAWALKGTIQLMNHESEAGIKCCKKAVELEPGNAEIQALMAFALCSAGNFEEARDHYETTLKLCPVCPNWYLLIGGQIEQSSGNLDRAVEILQQAIEVEPDSPLCRFYLIDTMLEKGDEASARTLADEIRALDKSVTGKGLIQIYNQDKSKRDRFKSNLEKVGFTN
jgi:TolB-like protein/predicted Zn-dependent protease